MRRLIPLLSLICLLVHTGVAHAESGVPPCSTWTVHPGDMDIPANLPAFFLERSGSFPGEPEVRFYERTPGGEVERPLEVRRVDDESYVLVPEDPLSAGGEYGVEVRAGSCPETTTLYRVGDEVPLPEALGTTVVSELMAANFGLPGPENRAYFVVVTLELTEAARAARAMFRMDVRVDDEPAPRSGPLETLHEDPIRLFVACPNGGIAPGLREFHHRASTWDDENILETAAVARELRCEDAIRVDPTDLRELTPEEIEEIDRPRMDAGMQVDAGVGLDASVGVDASPHDSTAAGCACRAVPSARAGSLAYLVVFFIALLLRVRRREDPGPARTALHRSAR